MKEILRSSVTDLDFTHVLLVSMLKRIDTYIKRGQQELIYSTVDAFITTARNHFAEEEVMFKDLPYPFRTRHAKEHYNFVELLFKFRDQCLQVRNFDVLQKNFDVLATILLEHINVTDAKLVKYL